MSSFVRRFREQAARTVVALQNRLAHPPSTSAELAERFHALYYDGAQVEKSWATTHFFGVPILKCPFDLWHYQELIYRLRPDVIVETGTFLGGSAFYYATLCDALGSGRVVTVDLLSGEECAASRRVPPGRIRPAHSRITYVRGSSTSPGALKEVRAHTAGAKAVLVVLDSDHSRGHVYEEMKTYGPLVTPGSYMVVEDGNINGHPVLKDFGPGPYEAINDFLRETTDFEVDQALEATHFFTFNPRGYLRRSCR